MATVSGLSPLTHDESKAAEAAFRGLPLNPHWSARAQAVYYGIVAVTNGQDIVSHIDQLPLAVGSLPHIIKD
jgi:hypothetical protein